MNECLGASNLEENECKGENRDTSDLGTELVNRRLVKIVDCRLVQGSLTMLLENDQSLSKKTQEVSHHQVMVDDLVIQVRYRLQTFPSNHGGVVNGDRHHIQHQIPGDSIFRQTMGEKRLLEGSHLDSPDPCGPDLTSSPYLILEEQVIKLLPPMLSSLCSSLYLEVLWVQLMAVVSSKFVALVIVSGPRCGRNRPILIPNVNITSMRTDVATLAVGSDGS